MKFELQNVTIDDVFCFPAHVVVGEDWNGFALPYFTLEQGKRLCEYLNAEKLDRWEVINVTDGIVASPVISKTEAHSFIEEFPSKYKAQGFYLTSKGEKIKPQEIKLEMQPAECGEDESHAIYNEASDSFFIHELDEDEEYEPIEYSGEDIMIDGKAIRAYPIGAGSWIWSVSTQLN